VAETYSVLGDHFRDLDQQRETSSLGMWVFLMTEVLLFGALFTAYAAIRYYHPAAFAEASRHLSAGIGTLNTAILIASSLAMAMAVHGAKTENRAKLRGGLALTILLGLVFLSFKGYEYYSHYQDSKAPGVRFDYPGPHAKGAELFFFLYFAMTGLHALHMTIGIGAVGFMLWRASRGAFSSLYNTPVELTGLYWHFVDIVWIFLFPLLYLIGLQR
jgi:cytochrome c oxidase subunit III